MPEHMASISSTHSLASHNQVSYRKKPHVWTQTQPHNTSSPKPPTVSSSLGETRVQ